MNSTTTSTNKYSNRWLASTATYNNLAIKLSTRKTTIPIFVFTDMVFTLRQITGEPYASAINHCRTLIQTFGIETAQKIIKCLT